MIQQTIASEWLNAIDGMTVKQAIIYLSQLDDSLILSHDLVGGDLQGVYVECCLIHEREETKEELAQQKEKHKQAKIARINRDIDSLLQGIEREQRMIVCQSFVYLLYRHRIGIKLLKNKGLSVVIVRILYNAIKCYIL